VAFVNMKEIVFAVGTTSPQKLGYVRKTLRAIGLKASIVSLGAASGVAAQPVTSRETRKGASNRARAARAKVGGRSVGVGIEVGYQKNKQGKFEMLCWVVLSGPKKEVAQASHSFELPEFHQKVLHSGKDLGEKVRAYHKNSQDAVRVRVGEVVRLRTSFIMVALEHALLRYINK
jgi:non-canonical (house-cleaning) NTP pyrophosphatase